LADIRDARSGCIRSRQNFRKPSRDSTGKRTNCGIEDSLWSFRSRMSEIRQDMAGSVTERIEERWQHHTNRDGDRVQYKEFRI
jgi:hypothetical protein